MRSKISYLVQAIDSVLQIVPSALMPNKWTPADAHHQNGGKEIFETYDKTSHTTDKSGMWQQGKFKASNSRGEKAPQNNGWVVGREGDAVLGGWFMYFIGCLLISIIIGVSSR
jgi:hypothetical protein